MPGWGKNVTPMPSPADRGSRTKASSASRTSTYLEPAPPGGVLAIDPEASTVSSKSTGTCSAFRLSSAQVSPAPGGAAASIATGAGPGSNTGPAGRPPAPDAPPPVPPLACPGPPTTFGSPQPELPMMKIRPVARRAANVMCAPRATAASTAPRASANVHDAAWPPRPKLTRVVLRWQRHPLPTSRIPAHRSQFALSRLRERVGVRSAPSPLL